MPRHRKDTNHTEIVKALKSLGFSVADLSNVGNGISDLLVSIHGITKLCEIKSHKKAKYTPDQILFKKQWKDKIYRLETFDDCVNLRNELLLKRMEK